MYGEAGPGRTLIGQTACKVLTKLFRQPCSRQEVSGQIFAVDSARGMLLLQHPAERHNTFDFTLINTDHVLEVVEAVPPERRASSAEEPLPEIDPARTKDRFQRSFRAAQLAAEKIGIGVSR